MQEPRADEVLVLDGEAIWSRATQETSNRLIAAVGSLLDGSRPACFPIENQHLAQWSTVERWRDRRAGDKFKLKFVLSEIDSGEDKFKLKFCHRQI